MTWTYGISLAADKDKVRFLCGDTDTTNQQVSDEEIAGNLAMNSSDIYRAGAAICRHLAARYSREANITIGQRRVELAARSKAYADRATEIETQGNLAGRTPIPYAGGISVADKERQEANEDRVAPFFTRDMGEFSFPSVTSTGSDD